MKMSHTSGPRLVQAFDEAQVCVLGPASDGGKRELVGVFTGEHRMDNAILDAVAPELLAIANRFCERVESGEIHSRSTYAEFKAVIAKAEPERKV